MFSSIFLYEVIVSLSVSSGDVFCSRLIMCMFSIYTWNSALDTRRCVPRHSFVCGRECDIDVHLSIKVHCFIHVCMNCRFGFVIVTAFFVDHSLFMNSSVIHLWKRVCVHLQFLARSLCCRVVGGRRVDSGVKGMALTRSGEGWGNWDGGSPCCICFRYSWSDVL